MLGERILPAHLVDFGKQNLQFCAVQKAGTNGVAVLEILLLLWLGQTIRW
jgi:hypothetical protein